MGSDAAREEEDCGELRRRADRICSLIVASDYPAVDLAIEIEKLREFARERFPHKMGLFRRIYESRFERLWEQFRSGPGQGGPPT